MAAATTSSSITAAVQLASSQSQAGVPAHQSLSVCSGDAPPHAPCIAVRQQASVLLLSPASLHPLAVLGQAPSSGGHSSNVVGVSFSPDGRRLAAWTATQLLLARNNAASAGANDSSSSRSQQLTPVAAPGLAGIRSAHWSPDASALAVCRKQQAEVLVLALGGADSSPAQQQQQVVALPGPQPASTTGPRCAAWVPCSGGDAPAAAALLVAWPTTLRLFTWQQPVSWGSFSSREILTGWQGPVRCMLVLGGDPLPPCPATGGDATASRDSAAVCTVVATVDAGLALQQQHTSGGISPTALAAATSAAVTAPQPVSLGAGAAAGVLDSLMNIHHAQHEQQPGPLPVPVKSPVLQQQQQSAAGAAAQDAQQASSQCCAHLCVLSISLRQVLQQPGSANGLAPQLTALARPSSSGGGYSCALPLPQQPQPSFLAAVRDVIAVGSSTLAPRVALVRHSRTAGLQLLQAVEVPLLVHGGGVADTSRQARLQGLQLLLEGEGTASSSSPGRVELLALLAVTDTTSQGPSLFAGTSATADMHLVKLSVETGGGSNGQPGQLHQQEHTQQRDNQQQQHPVVLPTPPGIDEGSQAIVAAIHALQASLEHRLDALCDAWGRTEGRLQALEQGHEGG